MNVLKSVTPVPFDPSNPEHRAEAKHFVETGSWSPDAIRFKVAPPFICVADLVRYELLKWYMSNDKMES